ERAIVPRSDLKAFQDIEDGILSELGTPQYTAKAQRLPGLDSKEMFDSAYPATGGNVLYNLSHPDLTISRAGYNGRSGPAVVGSGTDFAIKDPANIRSRFARFDPRLKHLANLSAGVGGAAVMLPREQQDEELRAYLGGLK